MASTELQDDTILIDGKSSLNIAKSEDSDYEPPMKTSVISYTDFEYENHLKSRKH